MDIIKELETKFKKEIPSAGYYIFNLPKDINKPAFLFKSAKRTMADANYYLNRVKLELPIVYFATKDNLGNENIEDKLKVIENLDDILGSMTLKVKDRNLRFSYGYGEIEGNLTISLSFEFMDEKELTLENHDTIENIKINNGKGCI